MRCAAAMQNRTVISLRVGAGRRCSGGLAMQMSAIGIGDDQAGFSGKNLARQILRECKHSRSQCARSSGHFWSARKSSIDDLISTIQISPRSFSATRSARRPDGSGNSLTQEIQATAIAGACRARSPAPFPTAVGPVQARELPGGFVIPSRPGIECRR